MVQVKSEEADSSTMEVDNPQEMEPKQLLQEVQLSESAYPNRAGEEWYIIGKKWMEHLKSFLEENAENLAANPGPIDNTDMIERIDNVNYLKTDVQKDEYEFLSEKLWKKLATKFGCVNSRDKQEIVAKVFEVTLLDYQIEPHPLIVECCMYPNVEKTEQIRIRRGSTVGECFQNLLVKFGVDIKASRLWLYTPNGTLELPDENADKRVSELDLSTQHLIVLEVAEKDGFPLDDEKAKTRLQEGLQRARNALHKPVEEKKTYNLRSGQQTRADTSSSSFDWNFSGSSTNVAGLVGLGNLGNTCFMNSSLQCISNVPELTRYFVSKQYENELNVDNPLGKGGEVAKMYADLVTQIWTTKNSNFYPTKFKSLMSRYTPLFNGAQQDSQESMQFIVDCLHEDLNRIRKKPYTEQNDEEDSKKTDDEKSAEAWDAYTSRNRSVIVDLFGGQVRSVLKCPDCHKTSTTFDPMMYYSLPLPSNQMKKLNYTFIPYKINTPSVKKSLTVSKTDSINDFLVKVSEQIRTVPPNYLFACEIHDNRIHQVHRGSDPVEGMHERKSISVFELPFPFGHEEQMPVIVYIRKLKTGTDNKPNYSTPNATLYDTPFIVAIPKKGIRATELYSSLYSKLLPRLRSHSDLKLDDTVDMGDSTENRLTNGTVDDTPSASTTDDENAGTGDDGAADETDTEMSNAIMAAPKIFSVCTINVYGNTPIETIKMNQKKLVEIKTYNNKESYLAVDFREEILEKLYNKTSEPVSEMDKTTSSFGRPAAETVDLKDCFRLFLQPERLGETNMWRCPHCKDFKCANKKLDLYKMPQYMFVHLKRFQYNRFYREKLNTRVKFPLNGLDISDLVINRKEHPVVYDLVGQSCHAGGLGGGHYWAICLNDVDKKWYKFDDSHVSPAEQREIESETSPYILVFRRRSPENYQAVSDTSEVQTENVSMDVDKDSI